MEKNTLFRKYQKRVAREGILKAIFCGLVAGSCVLLVTALLSWFFGFRGGIWLSIAMFAASAAATSLLLYFLRFRPTIKQVAVRMDSLGLEERLVTMLELEGDESYMATRQREDTVQAVSSANSLIVKIAVSVAMFVIVGVALLFGFGGGATVSALYYADVIPSGMDLVKGEEQKFAYSVSYGVASGADTGSIVLWSEDWAMGQEGGETVSPEPMVIEKGGNGPAVYAVAAPGYAFLKWSDGSRDPYRQDMNVMGKLNVTATFVEAGSELDELPPEDYDPNAKPSDSNNSNGKHQKGPGFEGDSEYGKPNPDAEGGGGTFDGKEYEIPEQDNKNINNGKTYYGDEFSDRQSDAQDRLNSDSNIGDDMKGWISDYFGGVASGSNDGSTGGDVGQGDASTGDGQANP